MKVEVTGPNFQSFQIFCMAILGKMQHCKKGFFSKPF
jgi:hypothetical protein